MGNTFAALVFKAFVAARRGSRSSYLDAAPSLLGAGNRRGAGNSERCSRAHVGSQSEPASLTVHPMRRREQKDAARKLL